MSGAQVVTKGRLAATGGTRARGPQCSAGAPGRNPSVASGVAVRQSRAGGVHDPDPVANASPPWPRPSYPEVGMNEAGALAIEGS